MEDVQHTIDKSIEDKSKKVAKYNVLGCNNCHRTKVTLIKAIDSYYCKECFAKLGKQKYQKKRGK